MRPWPEGLSATRDQTTVKVFDLDHTCMATILSLHVEEDMHINHIILIAHSQAQNVENISPGSVKLTYDTDILVQATDGFYYKTPAGEWMPGNIHNVSGRDVLVTIDPEATHLAYGWAVTVCEYKECAIYGADQEALPAQMWLWDLSRK